MTDASFPALTMNRSCPYRPPEEHLRLQAEAPISKVTLPDGEHAWALTRHQDVRAMLSDPRFSSDRSDPRFPVLVPRLRIPPTGDFRLSLLWMDPPEHTAVRRAVVGEFTVKRVQDLKPRIQQIVDAHIDTMLATGGPLDLVQTFAMPVPMQVVCELLGVPFADRDFIQSRTLAVFRLANPREERIRARSELLAYADEWITRKERDTTDDLVGRQIAKRRELGLDSRKELVELIFFLLISGIETTANMISLGTLTLLEHPDALAAVKQDPAKIAGAVEELLRFFTVSETATTRFAKEDVHIGEVCIRAGDAVVGLSNTANRDPAVYHDPHQFDIERNTRHHLAFGFGAHQCIGQNLARAELAIVFDTLFRRIPNLAIDCPREQLRFKDDGSEYGLHELPVTW